MPPHQAPGDAATTPARVPVAALALPAVPAQLLYQFRRPEWTSVGEAEVVSGPEEEVKP